MKKILPFVLLIFSSLPVWAQIYTVESPNKQHKIVLNVKDKLLLDVQYKGKSVFSKPAHVDLLTSKSPKGIPARVKRSKGYQVNNMLQPAYGNQRHLKNHFKALVIELEQDFSVELRAYNEGVAYRISNTGKSSDSVLVKQEVMALSFNEDVKSILPMVENYTSWEVPYVRYAQLGDIPSEHRSLTPALVQQEGVSTIVAESAVYNYPGMYLTRKNQALVGNWAQYPKETVMGSWGDFISVVTAREEHIAVVPGASTLPWRVFINTDRDAELLNNSLIYLLNYEKDEPPVQYDWVKPGRAVWEWWHDALLTDQKIPSGMENRSTQLYKYYVDFAGRHEFEYMMIDAGWSNVYNIQTPNPKIDMVEVIQHAQKQDVEVLLWCVASSLMKDLSGNLDYIRGLGARGIKVDFFDRDDQQAVADMELIAQEAAKRQLVVNFHGCTKPSGWDYKYPNVLNYEAVRGEECSKWDTTSDPDYHALIPFIRMLAGPLDYTPGSMRNCSMEDFKPVDPGLPMTMGTKVHELSLFLTFQHPLVMLSDSPDEYEKHPEALAFLKATPTSFDETRVLGGEIGQYTLMAKRSGEKWILGATNNWKAREITVDFDFLDARKNYTVKVLRDHPEDTNQLVSETKHVKRGSKLTFTMEDGGGLVMIMEPELKK